ncbi:Uncharacterised protein [Clostridium sporogenes]|nr:Uncharacterised protein [Clostridium sporogenes]
MTPASAGRARRCDAERGIEPYPGKAAGTDREKPGEDTGGRRHARRGDPGRAGGAASADA